MTRTPVRHQTDGMADDHHLNTFIASLPRPWRERSGVFYLPLWSDSMKGRDWSRRLKQLGREVQPGARKVLEDSGFETTVNIFRIIAILTARHKSSPLRDIFKTPPAEVGCLLREQLLARHLRLMHLSHVVIAHKPIQGNLLVIRENELTTCHERDPVDLGQQAYGIAYMVHEVAIPIAAVA